MIDLQKSLLYLVRDAETGRTPYIPEREIGRGAMGIAYKMPDGEVHKVTKMKQVYPDFFEKLKIGLYTKTVPFSYDPAGLVARTRNGQYAMPFPDDSDAFFSAVYEGQALQDSVNVPNIVQSLGYRLAVDPEGFLLCINAMNLVDGTNLKTLIDNDSLGKDNALQIIYDIAIALQGTHNRKIVHRDLKPLNIHFSFLEERATLLDFGLARSQIGYASLETLSPDFRAMLQRVQTDKPGVIFGTPAYLAPQQVTGEDLLSVGIDIFALSLIGFELFTGQKAFVSSDVKQCVIDRATYTNTQRSKIIDRLRTLIRDRFSEKISAVLTPVIEQGLDEELFNRHLEPYIDTIKPIVEEIRSSQERTVLIPVDELDKIEEISTSEMELIAHHNATKRMVATLRNPTIPTSHPYIENGRISRPLGAVPKIPMGEEDSNQTIIEEGDMTL